MHKYILLIITLLASSLQSTATTFYSTSSTATLANGGAPSNGWTLNPNGITGIGLQIIFEDDDIVLLNGASVEAAGGAQIANLTINGNCYISGSFEVRYTTTLNAGILTLGEATLQFGVGDNNTNAGKILGNPNGTTIGIDASFSDAYITFRGGNFTSFSPANIITIPNGTFIGNTISYLDINTFSLFGQYQIELNTAITITETLSISNGVLKTSTDANKKLLIDVNGYIYGTYQNPTEYGYVLGTLYRNTNAINTYEFPVAGSPSNFISPAIITGSASPSTFAMSSVDYELAENNPLSNMPKCNGSNLISVQAGLQYNIERVTGTADAAVRLHYFQKPYYYWSGGSGVAPTNIHRLVMAHYNTTSNCWERVSTQSQNGDVADAKITSDELTNFSPFTFGYGISASILPLQNLQFKAIAKNGFNILKWSSESEINTNRFEIEYSIDGNLFKKRGSESAKNLGVNYYAFSDNIPTDCGDVVYYRLKIVDNDGTYKYSEIVKLTVLKNNEITIYPNPAKDYIIVNATKNNTEIQILNSVGQIVLSQKVLSNNQSINIKHLRTGIYVAKILGTNTFFKFIKE